MTGHSREELNRSRWSVRRRNFYETYYLMWNDLEADRVGWVRYTVCNSTRGASEAAVWGVVLDGAEPHRSVTIKQVHALSDVRTSARPFRFDIAGSGLTDTEAWGEVASGDATMAWHLRTLEAGPAISLVPRPLYRLPVPTKFVAPSCWYRAEGDLTVNGEAMELANGWVHQAHFWGNRQAAGWTWANCAKFDGDSDFAYQGVIAHLRRGWRPTALLAFRYRGRIHLCNGTFQSFARNRTAYSMDGCTLEARDGELRFRGTITATPEDMIVYQHVDPDGSVRHTHVDVAASMIVTVERRTPRGWVSEETVTATRTAKFEVAKPERDARVSTGLGHVAEAVLS